jgi:hypothetical protein
VSLGDALDSLAETHSGFLEDIGTAVTVVRRGPSPKTFTASCSIQELKPEDVARLRLEGSINASDARPTMFIFPGNTDIQEAVDSVQWSGWEWKIVSLVPTPGKTLNLNKRILGIRRARI